MEIVAAKEGADKKRKNTPTPNITEIIFNTALWYMPI